MKKAELLAPAGDLEKLYTAIDYGADAVYTGGEMFSLRTACDNFSVEDMARGVEYAHRFGKKVYLACNCFPHNHEIALLPEYIRNMAQTGIDGCIVSDLGSFSVIRETCPDLKLHISTQASTANYASCMAWYRLGAKRIVLSRELSLREITEIRRRIPADLELETFVHGAVCVSHSGRCLLSDYMAGRSANRGDCAHSCRWKYALVEEQRPNQYMPITETDTGTFIMNSKDLNMIRHLPEMLMAGIDSLKIEGRVKSSYYVASIVSAYRRALDTFYEDMDEYMEKRDEFFEDTCKVSHREYFTGFFLEDPKREGQQYGSASYIRDWEVCAQVLRYDALRGLALCEQRNKFFQGDTLEALYPQGERVTFDADILLDEQYQPIASTPHAAMRFYVKVPKMLPKGAYLRRQLRK